MLSYHIQIARAEINSPSIVDRSMPNVKVVHPSRSKGILPVDKDKLLETMLEQGTFEINVDFECPLCHKHERFDFNKNSFVESSSKEMLENVVRYHIDESHSS